VHALHERPLAASLAVCGSFSTTLFIGVPGCDWRGLLSVFSHVEKRKRADGSLRENLGEPGLGRREIDIECERQLRDQDLASVDEHVLLGV
jgi:hypothetical protein